MKRAVFVEGNTTDFEKTVKEEMEAPIKHFEKELTAIRTGRATTSSVENIKIEAYGQIMTVRELATISVPDARLITIQPWDKGTLEAIEKGIMKSDLGIPPVNDGKLIRLQFPMLSTQRRDELVKILGKKTEDAKVGVRNVRKEFHNQLREAEREKLLSEDFAIRLNNLLQKITDEFIAIVDRLAEKKSTELKTI